MNYAACCAHISTYFFDVNITFLHSYFPDLSALVSVHHSVHHRAGELTSKFQTVVFFYFVQFNTDNI